METKDGTSGFDFEGINDEVVVNKKICHTTSDGRKSIILFIKTENGIKISETFEQINEHPHEPQKKFCQAILNNFKKYTESKNKFVKNK